MTKITKSKKGEFVPRIIVFACNWCSYAGADNAGISRIQYSPYFRIIRVMCSGRVHPNFVLKAFLNGVDGVLVSGCHFGDCHYIFGNHLRPKQSLIHSVLRIKELDLNGYPQQRDQNSPMLSMNLSRTSRNSGDLRLRLIN